ncbi:hypothetical protein LJB81_04155 [Desulfovibrio sp. OttesenSCG-928-M14]|nr:hypothetical protein [Desulfovibrio sp. OttesenSCG-928-M14]
MSYIFSKTPDARLCVLLAALTGLLVWQAGLVGLVLYVLALLVLLWTEPLRRRVPRDSLKRCILFSLAWPLLKCLTDLFTLTLMQDLSVNLLSSCADAGLLFLRLLVIMLLGLILGLAVSPPAMALAVSRLLRPFVGQRAWSVSLALALMLRHMARIHELAAQTRQAALVRGLTAKGPAFFKIALPHMFRILAKDTHDQALGLASRNLGRPQAWSSAAPLPKDQALAALALAGLLVLLAQ